MVDWGAASLINPCSNAAVTATDECYVPSTEVIELIPEGDVLRQSALMIALVTAACGSADRRGEQQVEPECAVHTDCQDWDVCARTQCVSAMDRGYRLTVKSADLPENGPWEAENPVPDTFVVVTVDNTRLGETAVRENTFSPEWNESFDLTIHASTQVAFSLFQREGSRDILAKRYIATSMLDLVRKEEHAVSIDDSGLKKFRFSIVPR